MTSFRLVPWSLAALAAGMVMACDDGEVLPALTVISPAFGDGDPIPLRHTCEGDEISPPIWVGDMPEEAVSLALICEERGGNAEEAVRWVLWGIPADIPGIGEGMPRAGEVSGGLLQGVAADGEPGYLAPCPPQGEELAYDFQVYALDTAVDLAPGATAADLRGAIKGSAVAKGTLRGWARGK